MAVPRTERSVVVQSTDAAGSITVAEYSEDQDLVLIESCEDGNPVLVEGSALYAACAFCMRHTIPGER